MKGLRDKTTSELEGLAFMADYVMRRSFWFALILIAALIVWSVAKYPLPREVLKVIKPEWISTLGRAMVGFLLAIAWFYRGYARKVRTELAFR